MKKCLIIIAASCICLAILFSAQAADGPAKNEKPAAPAGEVKAEKPAVEVISVTIHPAAAPKPALKYHLLPTFLESEPGNAVPCYLKALIRHVEIWRQLCDTPPSGEKCDLDLVDEWLTSPLDKLPRDRARKLVDSFGGTVRSQLEMAVRRERCDWDMPLRQGHVFEILLPEVQEFRNMARIVALRARLQIAEGKYTEALDSLKVGYGMARQISEQPLLISGLVSATIIRMMNEQLLTLLQQPNTPNLYWSIAALPSPMIDMRKATEGEYDGLYLEFPEMQAMRRAHYAPEQWDRVLRDFVLEMKEFDAPIKDKSSDKDRAKEISASVDRVLALVPKAKKDLIEAGYAQKDLDAMPPSQIVMLHVVETYDKLRDDTFKWIYLPYWQGREGMEAIDRDLKTAKNQELIPTASVILPLMHMPYLAYAKTDRQLAVLRCIEALRLYAAAHDGKLPTTLDEIKEVPIPVNPVTGKPFRYHLEGETAMLDVDGGPENQHPPQPQYRITVAK